MCPRPPLPCLNLNPRSNFKNHSQHSLLGAGGPGMASFNNRLSGGSWHLGDVDRVDCGKVKKKCAPPRANLPLLHCLVHWPLASPSPDASHLGNAQSPTMTSFKCNRPILIPGTPASLWAGPRSHEGEPLYCWLPLRSGSDSPIYPPTQNQKGDFAPGAMVSGPLGIPPSSQAWWCIPLSLALRM